MATGTEIPVVLNVLFLMSIPIFSAILNLLVLANKYEEKEKYWLWGLSIFLSILWILTYYYVAFITKNVKHILLLLSIPLFSVILNLLINLNKFHNKQKYTLWGLSIILSILWMITYVYVILYSLSMA